MAADIASLKCTLIQCVAIIQAYNEIGCLISNLPTESSFTKAENASKACSFVSKLFTRSLNKTGGIDEELKKTLTSSYA